MDFTKFFKNPSVASYLADKYLNKPGEEGEAETPPAEAAAPAVNPEAERLKALLDQARAGRQEVDDAHQAAGFLEGANTIGRGIAGVEQNPGAISKGLVERAAARAKGFEQDRALEKDLKQETRQDKADARQADLDNIAKEDRQLALDEKKNKKDPNSEEARRAREAYYNLGGGLFPAGSLDNLTADEINSSRSIVELAQKAKQSQEDLNLRKQELGEKREDRKLARAKTEAEIKKLEAEASGVNSEKKASGAFEKKQMEKFAESAAEYSTKDRPILSDNLNKVKSAVSTINDAMKKGESLFGILPGNLPEAAGKVAYPKTYAVLADMRSAVQDTLRPTLGAQFTEKEGQRIMDLAIDPRLGEEENLRRAKRLQQLIDTKIKFSDAFYEHLRSGGNAKDFDFAKYGMEYSGGGEAPKKGSEKTVAKTLFSPSRNQTKIIYSDGSEEVVDGKR